MTAAALGGDGVETGWRRLGQRRDREGENREGEGEAEIGVRVLIWAKFGRVFEFGFEFANQTLNSN